MKNKKYVTVKSEEGLGLYDIANIMTKSGHKMNHSTVRNIINRSFVKIAENISKKYGMKHSNEDIFNIAKSPQFQESVIELFTNSSITTLVGIPFVFVNIFVIYLIAGPLALVTAGICALTLASSIFYYFTVVGQAEEAKKAGIDKSSVFLEAISNLESLKSIGDYEYFEEKWKDVDGRTRAVSSKLRDSLADVGSVNAMVSSLGQVAIVAVGAYLVINGSVSSGALIASVILNGRTVQPLTQLAGLLQKFSTARASFQRLDKVFMSVSEEEKRRQNIRLDKISGPITVENLIFQPKGVPAPLIQVPKIRITDGQKKTVRDFRSSAISRRTTMETKSIDTLSTPSPKERIPNVMIIGER